MTFSFRRFARRWRYLRWRSVKLFWVRLRWSWSGYLDPGCCSCEHDDPCYLSKAWPCSECGERTQWASPENLCFRCDMVVTVR